LADISLPPQEDCCVRSPHDRSPSRGLLARFGFDQHPYDVAFRHDHVLVAVDLDLGAGPLAEQRPVATYTVDTDEELLDGLSFLAYRRVGTLLHLPSTSSQVGVTELVNVNPSELEAALKKDIQESGSNE
jgi:hypothetical protein